VTNVAGQMQAPPGGTVVQVLVLASQLMLPRHVSLLGSQASPGLGRATHVAPMQSV